MAVVQAPVLPEVVRDADSASSQTRQFGAVLLELTLASYPVTAAFPRDEIIYGLTSPMRRAASSISSLVAATGRAKNFKRGVVTIERSLEAAGSIR